MSEKTDAPESVETAVVDRWRARYWSLMADTREGHLLESEWEHLALDEAGLAERERAFEHVTRCSQCAELYRGLQQLRQEARAFDAAVPQGASDAGRLRAWQQRLPDWALWVAAAAAAIVAALPWLPDMPWPDPGSGRATRAPVSRASVTLIEPKGSLSTVPRQLRWTGVSGAESYRVRLFREDGALLWMSEPLSETSLEWPRAVELAPGRYFWEVVTFRDGSSLARSELVAFELRP